VQQRWQKTSGGSGNWNIGVHGGTTGGGEKNTGVSLEGSQSKNSELIND
jgi:hypothetical protein